MKLFFYAVKDLMTERYMSPALSESDEVATRQFKSNINHINLWKDNPQDFDLWRLGTYDDETGEILYDPHKVVNGRSAYVPVQTDN